MSGERKCPICRRALAEDPASVRFRPFCSKRCADVDLGRWLGGTYAIPAVESEDETAEEGTGERKPEE
jgi:uncharacterized protein